MQHTIGRHSLIQLVSRTGSFPLGLATELIREFGGQSNSIVLDPFCGRGTTILAARILGHKGYGLDVAPEAVVSSQAMMVEVTLASLDEFLSELRLRSPEPRPVPTRMRAFFHPRTLKDAIAVSEALRKARLTDNRRERDVATFALGCLVGILHGHASYSLSVESSHAFAMAPDYVRRYAKANSLKRPVRDVRHCILEKAKRVLRDPQPQRGRGEVKRAQAESVLRVFPSLKDKVDLILTSPPYLNAQTYSKDNWLRQWFLGFDSKSISGQYLQTGSVARYGELITESFTEIARCLKPGGLLVVIAGDVRVRSGHRPYKVQTASVIAEACESLPTKLRRISERVDTIDSRARYLHAINRSNGHSAKPIRERVVVLQRDG